MEKDIDRKPIAYESHPYDLNIYGKTHVQCVKKAHVQRRHVTTQNLPLNVAFLRIGNHGLMRIVRNLIVKKYLGAVLRFQ